jgi:hypothetical protein
MMQLKRVLTKHRLTRLSAIWAIGAVLLLPVASATSASASVTAHPQGARAAWVAHEVKGLLAHNPGSRQISAASIKTTSGAVITAIPDTVSGRCQNGYTCLFWDSNWGGDQLTLGPYNDCGYYDLHYDYGSNGREWANEPSSIDNANPRPGSALFYHNGSKIYTLAPGHYLRDLSKDKASNGHSMNDYITEAWSC